MKLYRYELYCEDEPQDVGFLVGLEDLGLSCEAEEYLLDTFDSSLNIPDPLSLRDSVSFFTEEGNRRFQSSIVRIANAYEDSIFDVRLCTLNLPKQYWGAITYQDADLVCIQKKIYAEKLNPFTSRRTFPSAELSEIILLAENVREEMTAIYGDDLAGHCIEASERIVQAISTQLGISATTVEGWCRFDDEYYGSDRPWDPHTWVEVPSLGLYIDVTADQFNWGMDRKNEFPKVIVRAGLPWGMQYKEPTWSDFGYENAEDLYQEKEPLITQIQSASTRAIHSGFTFYRKGPEKDTEI